MKGFKEPTFQERTAAAKRAKEAALEKLRNKPPVDQAEQARKAAKRLAREQEAAARRTAVLEARKADKEAKAAAAAAALEAGRPVVLSEAERKAARDARYAARKNRK